MAAEVVPYIALVAIPVSGWAALQVIKIPALEEDVKYIKDRVDALYDHLIGDGPEKGRRGSR